MWPKLRRAPPSNSCRAANVQAHKEVETYLNMEPSYVDHLFIIVEIAFCGTRFRKCCVILSIALPRFLNFHPLQK